MFPPRKALLLKGGLLLIAITKYRSKNTSAIA
jgi:hypothetical protein